MKDKILKQIEEESLRRFPIQLQNNVDYNYENRCQFIYHCEWYHNNIKESVDEKLIYVVNQFIKMKTPKFESLYEEQNYEEIYQLAIEAIGSVLSASQNTVSNEGEKERLIDFLCYLNNNKMINNYDFDYEQEASEYLSIINPPTVK